MVVVFYWSEFRESEVWLLIGLMMRCRCDWSSLSLFAHTHTSILTTRILFSWTEKSSGVCGPRLAWLSPRIIPSGWAPSLSLPASNWPDHNYTSVKFIKCIFPTNEKKRDRFRHFCLVAYRPIKINFVLTSRIDALSQGVERLVPKKTIKNSRTWHLSDSNIKIIGPLRK